MIWEALFPFFIHFHVAIWIFLQHDNFQLRDSALIIKWLTSSRLAVIKLSQIFPLADPILKEKDFIMIMMWGRVVVLFYYYYFVCMCVHVCGRARCKYCISAILTKNFSPLITTKLLDLPSITYGHFKHHMFDIKHP